MTREYLIGCITLFLLALAQNVAFSVVSRSRNRNNLKYHLVAAFFSNGVWYLTFRSLVTAGMTLDLFWWYCAGTMIGSCTGVKISMKIEKWLGIASDDHIKKAPVVTVVDNQLTPAEFIELRRRLNILWEQHPQGFFHTPKFDRVSTEPRTHFDKARDIVGRWPDWKRNIGHRLDPEELLEPGLDPDIDAAEKIRKEMKEQQD